MRLLPIHWCRSLGIPWQHAAPPRPSTSSVLISPRSRSDGATFYFYTEDTEKVKFGCPGATSVAWSCQQHVTDSRYCGSVADEHALFGASAAKPRLNVTRTTDGLIVEGRCGSLFEHFHPVGTGLVHPEVVRRPLCPFWRPL
jgi:hypothetical protein